jgi:two-component system CheB/CheR fusion protein
MRVLVVDDYPAAAEAACILLGMLGHETKAALTGESALAQAETFAPHAVILDIGLPDLSGYEVARELRARPNGDQVYIAALTGWDQPEDRAKSRAAGIDLHVLKPASAEKLVEILGHVTSRR